MFSFQKINYKIEGYDSFSFPMMAKVEQTFPRPRVDDLSLALKEEFEKIGEIDLKGKRIAITVGSRGIPNIPEIIRLIGFFLKQKGGCPFIVPAMGSHGNASSEGQKEVLKNLGITEQSMGMQICSSMETVLIGYARDKVPVYFDKVAFQADGVVVCGRIKPHTDFCGEIESGLCKMIGIGLGNHKGAFSLHQEGMENFPWLLPEVADFCISRSPILFGIGIIDNAYHETAKLVLISPSEIISKEQVLLQESRRLMAKLYFEEIDILVVDQIGKEISGAGMDPNVIGRTVTGSPGFDHIKIKRIVVLGLSESSKGHASGISMADVTTLKVANSIDFAKIYTNSIASACPNGGGLPMVLNNERDAVMVAIIGAKNIFSKEVRLVRIKNTMDLKEILISESLLPKVKVDRRFRVISDLEPFQFNEE